MNPMCRICFAGIVLWVAPCVAGEARNDFDPDVDFSRFKTFTFIGGKDLEKSGWLDEPEMRERFKNFISGALEMRGLTEVPKDQTHSLAVRYWVARRQKQDALQGDRRPAPFIGRKGKDAPRPSQARGQVQMS